MSREQLRREVWGRADVDDNLIDVTVSQLRQRIEQTGPRLIYTVYGGGYRLVE